MWKETLIVLLFALCTRVKAVDLDKKHLYGDRPEEMKNLPPLISIQNGNPVHITKQEENNNIYSIPTLQPHLPVQTLNVHKYNQNTNILRTIIIVPPKTKKPCDRNSSVSQPPIQTENPTKYPSDTITTTEKPTTIPQNTKKPCNISTTTTNIYPTTPIQVTPTSITLVTSKPTEITQTTTTKVTPTPNDVTRTPANDPITKAPIIGDPDGSLKCIQDGVYRANEVTCDQYYVCIHGIRYLMDCPYGLVFNNQLKICDWLENVSDCKPPAFKDFACPDEGYDVDGSLILRFRYQDSCSQFVACHKRNPRLLSCGTGYYFHEESGTCMNFRSASNCRDVWYSY